MHHSSQPVVLFPSYDSVEHYPSPHINRTDYYYLFRWNDYLKAFPKSQRNWMMSDLREEWMQLTPEERYPFEIISSEDEREYKRRMKEVDPELAVSLNYQ